MRLDALATLLRTHHDLFCEGNMFFTPDTKVRRFASWAYWRAQRAIRFIFGSKIDELHFQFRKRDDVRRGFSNVLLPHRPWLVIHILGADDVETVLEVGCGWGPNLEVLAHYSPQLLLTGLDIGPSSIAEGRKHFEELGFEHVSLMEGRSDDLSRFGDASIDIVFTDAVLLYVGPDKIESSLREMIRVARRRVVMLEMSKVGLGAVGQYTRDGWVRDFEALLFPMTNTAAVTLKKLPSELRPAGRWSELGMLIEIDVTKKSIL